jgi:uncharacterized protein GlcG (DUF336 family)
MFDWLRRRRARSDGGRKRLRSAHRPARRLAFEGLEERSLLSIDVYEGGSFAAAATGTSPADSIIVTAADSGGGPHVRVLNTSDGSQRFSFFAFDPAFRGGVRVAAGDVTGDGVPDIVAAAGPGGGPHVRVFDGATGAPLPGAIGSFFAYDPSFTGGVFVAAGDVTGDGRADVITGAGSGGASHVRVFDGATGAPLAGPLGGFLAFDAGFIGGVSVAVGDITGDGRGDVITGAGAGGGPHVRVFDAVTGAQLPGSIGSFFAYGPGFSGGVFVAAGDANADSQVDLITGAGAGGGPHVRIFHGATAGELFSSFVFSSAYTGGVRPAAADFNGDGRTELVAAPGDGGRGRAITLTPLGPPPDLMGLELFSAFAPPGAGFPQLTPDEVQLLLKRAAAVSASEEAIIAVVDRNGRILGVRVEQGVLNTTTSEETLVFAIDGAVAKARTAAFFANGELSQGTFGPLTSRTIRFISQSTVTQREVESSPMSPDPLTRGPGFVAPVGVGGRFPPEVLNTPLVDLFAIEHTNRDSIVHPGANGVRESGSVTFDALGNVEPMSLSGDDALLPARFNIDPAFVPAGQEIYAPESYGFVSGRVTEAQSRGIATIPGGIPLFRDTNADSVGDTLIGGIGVFFPGPDGFATYEQGFVPGIGQTATQRINTNRVLEAEFIALAAAGGSLQAGAPAGAIGACPPVAGLDLPFGRIFLVGIDLETVGPHPQGVQTLMNFGRALTPGSAMSGADQPIDALGTLYQEGVRVPEGWLVTPHDSPLGITAADVERIISQGLAEANLVRAQIRLPEGNRTRMVLAISDTDGNVLGLYRMPDATVFSIDVAVAKARNTAYYADASVLQPEDRVDDNRDGIPDVAAGVAFSNRTFRFLAAPRFPSSAEGSTPGAFSILRDPGIHPQTGENLGATPASPAGMRFAPDAYTSVLAYDAFNPGTNFHDPGNPLNQNGIVFFPGSLPLYGGGVLVGGWGVSGDGVDQDDVVTFSGAQGYLPPPTVPRADQVFVRNVRLPFLNFPRNPRG